MAEKTSILSEAERDLVRRALGLPNRRHRSRRAHYLAATDPTFEALVARGLATVRRSAEPNGRHTYRPTRAGAEAALATGETLDQEDFPD